jgi:short-subunit dehydrogenase
LRPERRREAGKAGATFRNAVTSARVAAALPGAAVVGAMTDRAIVVGASSGIGEALAHELADDGYEVGLAARRLERLEEIGGDLPTKAYVARIDVTDTGAARDRLRRLVDAMGGCDLLVLSAGVGELNPDLDWEPERGTIDVNVRGFTALATLGMELFAEQGSGHLVGISSVASNFGNGGAPAYNASKAYVCRYLEGLRYWADNADADVAVTDVEPGYVDTEMALGDRQFWMASPETAAAQIADAIRDRRRHVYVTRRWRLVAWFLRLMPERVLSRLFA